MSNTRIIDISTRGFKFAPRRHINFIRGMILLKRLRRSVVFIEALSYFPGNLQNLRLAENPHVFQLVSVFVEGLLLGTDDLVH